MQQNELDFLRQKELALKEFERLYNPPRDKVLSPIIKEQKKEEKSPPIKTKPKQNFGLDLLNIFNFKGLNLIEEHLIIIAIILLLSIENADEILILALVYILL